MSDNPYQSPADTEPASKGAAKCPWYVYGGALSLGYLLWPFTLVMIVAVVAYYVWVRVTSRDEHPSQ